MKALSALAQSVRASTTMAIDTQFKKMRAEGIDVIGFSVGEPDFPTPEHIKQAGIRAIENDQTKYTPTPGTLALRQAVRKGFLNATEVADYLVKKGVPFRDAHGIVGQIVIHCEDAGKAIEDLSLEELRKFSGCFEEDIYPYIDYENILHKGIKKEML